MVYQNPERKIIDGNRGEWAGTAYDPEAYTLHLTYIQVPKDERGNGLARALLDQVVALAESHGAFKLTAEINTTDGLGLLTDYFGEEAIQLRRRSAPQDVIPSDNPNAQLNFYL